jgi:hypothetical protein
MKPGNGDPPQSSDGLLQRSSLTDVVFLVVVIGVIIAAILFRRTHRTERATPARTDAAAATVPQGRSGAIPFAVPVARDDVKRDLRNLVTAQEWVFADSIHYVDDISLLTRERGLILTSGATIRIVWADAMGWAATAESVRLGGGSCVIRLGPVPDSLRPRTKVQHREGEEAMPRCDGDP